MIHDIFSYFVANDDVVADGKRVSYMLWFAEHFPNAEFHSEERILYEYVRFSSVLRIPLKKEYFDTFVQTDLRKFLKKHPIKIAGTEELNYEDVSNMETAVGIIDNVLSGVIVSWEDNPKDISDFIVSAKAFLHDRLNERMTEVLSSTFDMKSETSDAQAALSYAQEQFELLREIYDDSILEELDVTSPEGKRETIEFICDTGLPGIDADIGGIYRTQLGGVEAAPGTGKTRFALGVWGYRAAVYHSKSVLFYTLEQSKQECEAMLIARHAYELYSVMINDSLIYKDQVPDEYKELVESARMDLFESDKYGKIEIVETDLYMETFIDKIKAADRLRGPFDMIIIDYMALIGEKSHYGKPKSIGEIVSYCYKSFKKYVRNNKKAGIAVNQLNREGIEASKAGKEITTEMAQGGLEAYRSTDFNLTISATKEMELQRKRRISQPKKRSSEGIGSLIVDTRLGVCLFYQQANKIV